MQPSRFAVFPILLCIVLFFFFNSAAADQATHFSLPALDGHVVNSRDFVGSRPTLLMFWATWCPSCRQELPVLESLHKDYGLRGLTVIAINIAAADPLPSVQALVKKCSISFPVLYDEGQKTSKAYRVMATPFILLIDRTGEILYKGHDLPVARIRALFDEGAEDG